jgi:hypothetical protein
LEKYAVVYRTKEVTLIDGTIKGYRVLVYQDPTTIRVTFVPYDEEQAPLGFSCNFQEFLEVDNPKDLLGYVDLFSEFLI